MTSPDPKEARRILEQYTTWLVDHGYCDDDVWSEEPKAVDRFLNACCFCGEYYGEYGNNAEPLNSGHCCDECNLSKVVPARLTPVSK